MDLACTALMTTQVNSPTSQHALDDPLHALPAPFLKIRPELDVSGMVHPPFGRRGGARSCLNSGMLRYEFWEGAI